MECAYCTVDVQQQQNVRFCDPVLFILAAWVAPDNGKFIVPLPYK